MENNTTDRAIAGQGAFMLSTKQKRELILIAQKAYAAQQKAGLVDESFEVWRKAVCWDVVQKDSFRKLTQRDFVRVLTEFNKLAGRKVNFGIVARSQGTDDRSRAMWKLENEVADLADAFGGLDGAWNYVDSLLRMIHKTTRDHASAGQIWQVIFTLRKRARAKKSGG